MNEITLARTGPIIPSKLGVFIDCPARYLLESEQNSLQRLPLHPRTILGSVVHRLANIIQKNRENSSFSIIRQLENDFVKALTNTQRIGPLTAWIQGHYGIAGFVSRQTLLEQIRYAKSLTRPVSELTTYSAASAEKREHRVPVGREQLLTSAFFNMSGRADLIYQKDTGKLRIVDYKTGKVTDEQNQPIEKYLLQIAAYGVILKEMAPDRDVELELAGIHDNWAGPLDAYLKERITQILVKLNNTLPLNVAFSSHNIAQPGRHCVLCNSRCSCPVYLEKLQHRMQQHQFDYNLFGNDICGRLISIEGDNHLSILKLQLANSYIVKVFRIPTQIIPKQAIVAGSYLKLYGLRILGEKKEGQFPRNFYVVDGQDPKRSAFQFLLQLDEEFELIK